MEACDIGKLLSSGDNHDVIIQAGESQNMKEFFAHSLILGARSTYFKAALSTLWAKKENGMLEYLIATDELNLQNLSDYIQLYLIRNQTENLRNETVEILQILFNYEDTLVLPQRGRLSIDSIDSVLIGKEHLAIIARYITRVLEDKSKYAVYYRSNVGPAFGIGWNIGIENNKMSRYGDGTYPGVNIILEYSDYSADILDYEVFQAKDNKGFFAYPSVCIVKKGGRKERIY
ncbi:5989_t:CDS:2 [Funneliformis geosporum]|nr:5989_t:CDS:2 [Funneliformis geosporum]